MAARAPLWSLLAASGFALAGCSIGLQQTLLSPKVNGSYTFSGVDMVATSPPSWSGKPFNLPVKLPAQSGQLGPLGTLTQLPIGLDFPAFRLVVAPGISNVAHLDSWQVDALYKHPLPVRGNRANALIGLSYFNLDATVTANYQLALDAPVSIGNAVIQNGDSARYAASENHAGWYIAAGVEYALAAWAHVFVQAQGKLAESSGRTEDLVITARNGGYNSKGQMVSQDFHVLSDPNFVVTQKQKGSLSADLKLPSVTALVGVSLTLPVMKVLTALR